MIVYPSPLLFCQLIEYKIKFYFFYFNLYINLTIKIIIINFYVKTLHLLKCF
jgi:hypothetical protein